MTVSINALELLQRIYELSIAVNPPSSKPVFFELLNKDIQNYKLLNSLIDELYQNKYINYNYDDKTLMIKFNIKDFISNEGLNEIGINNNIYEARNNFENLLIQLQQYKKNIKKIEKMIHTVERVPVKALLKSILTSDSLINRFVAETNVDDMNFLNDNKKFILEELDLYLKINNNLNNLNLKNVNLEILKETFSYIIEEKKLINNYKISDLLEKNKDKNNVLNDNAEKCSFKGIMGQVCGRVISDTSAQTKKIQDKGFYVNDGIRVLRGFAKASDLASFSSPDSSYQRNEDEKHLEAIKKFMTEIKTSAKYLPEVTLVARNYKEPQLIKISGSLSTKQKGEIDNLEYYELTVNKGQLYRIDGNHRLSALENEDFYIPFAIILWGNSENSVDDEAFLFYFLNSKAKKLTTEENIKGLVNAKTWTNYELNQANVILPYIRYFSVNYENNPLFNKEYYNDEFGQENVKIQLLEVLEIILGENSSQTLPFEVDIFGDYIKKTQEILSQRDRFKYLRTQFNYFPQLVFYTLYKNCGDTEKSISFLNETNDWAEFYKHDFNSFIQPNKMYHNAVKQLKRQINIFVAMPYYDETTVAQFNKTFETLINEIKEENEIFEDKVNLYPIMTYKAESTDILANMDKQIGECDIFIADISNHGKSKVNPNVMFELGRVYDSKKFILIRDKDNKVNNSAFDIQHIDYVPIDFGMGFDTSMKTNLKPRIVNILKSIIGFC